MPCNEKSFATLRDENLMFKLQGSAIVENNTDAKLFTVIVNFYITKLELKMKTQASSQTVPQTRSAPAVAAAKMEIATKCWLELVAYPAGTARSLWLQTSSGWKVYDDPTPNIESAVMNACGNDDFEIRVWFDSNKVVGLVVNSK